MKIFGQYSPEIFKGGEERKSSILGFETKFMLNGSWIIRLWKTILNAINLKFRYDTPVNSAEYGPKTPDLAAIIPFLNLLVKISHPSLKISWLKSDDEIGNNHLEEFTCNELLIFLIVLIHDKRKKKKPTQPNLEFTVMCKIKNIRPRKKVIKSRGKIVNFSLLALENQRYGINVNDHDVENSIITNNWSSIGTLFGKIKGTIWKCKPRY